MTPISTIVRCLLLSVSLLAAGCATAPQPAAGSPPSASPPEGSGRIIFYRPSDIFGYAMRSDILLDGKTVGRSAPGIKFHVDAMPGSHRVSVPNSLYSGDRALEVTVRNGETLYVRTSLGGSAFGGRTNVELVGASTGAQESANLELVKY